MFISFHWHALYCPYWSAPTLQCLLCFEPGGGVCKGIETTVKYLPDTRNAETTEKRWSRGEMLTQR